MTVYEAVKLRICLLSDDYELSEIVAESGLSGLHDRSRSFSEPTVLVFVDGVSAGSVQCDESEAEEFGCCGTYAPVLGGVADQAAFPEVE
jgi:hypothetical protein